jgi:tetratricopeptide (TPR) repeat protein
LPEIAFQDKIFYPMSNELAEQFLKSAEELIEAKEGQERLLEVLDQAEKLLPEDVSVLCRSARLLFRYGVLNSKGRFYLLALDKLKLAEEKNPLFFDCTTVWWQLWGNILIQLGKLLNDVSLFELALQKYQKAEKVTTEINAELYWDVGEAWVFLGQKSGEPTDFQKGLAYFYLAQSLGISSHFFRLDHAYALSQYGMLSGDPAFLEQSIALLRSVITDAYHPNKEPSVAYVISWRKLALAMNQRFQLTQLKDHFEEAETIFRDAILAASKNGELWLDWGEFYLRAGWLKRDFKIVETAIDKLTSTKIKECDPIRASYLLGMALLIFGLFLENLKLLKDGQERIRSTLEVAPRDAQLQFASAFADLSVGLYFADQTAYSRAAAFFESVLQEDAFSVDHLYALFQTYMAWGLKENDLTLLQKALVAITRLCQLRPYSYIHLNEWGVALLRLRRLDQANENHQAYVEEAIDKFQKASALCEDEETLYNWGCALDVLGDLTADEEDQSL